MASSTTTFTAASGHNHHDRRQKSTCDILVRLFLSMLVVSYLVAIVYNQLQKRQGDRQLIANTTDSAPLPETQLKPVSRWQVGGGDSIKWQQPAFHFLPHKDFISDPDGPLYYMGWYHLFYQYNPESVVWGNYIRWAHAVSKDLVNWLLLPLALVPDHWYDINGVMTGSATILPDGRPMMIYSSMANDFTQLQSLAFPKNSSDPLLIDWVKYNGNPVLYPPPGIGLRDFRDPSSLWIGPDGKYRMIMGSKRNNTIGCVLVFHTRDFINYELLDDVLHSVQGTGMWECVDIYPVSTTHANGLDMAVYGSGVKYVLKQSGDEDRHDWYAIGSYDAVNDKWYPDDPEMDLGIGLRYDYGKFYASKTFYDPRKKRRVLWGYVGETDTVKEDRAKGWANILNFPRTVTLDIKTQRNLIQWPIEEVETLRYKQHQEFENVELRPGSVVRLDIDSGSQLDINALFKIDKARLDATLEADVSYNCTTSTGSAGRGGFGPFGLLVLADERFTEQTPVYFYIAKNTDGTSTTYFCTDESRSSTLSDVGKRVYGSTVPVLHGEDYNMRLLVDHSIVESFAQGGRTVISSRVYPTKAIYRAAKVYLFNNATSITVKASLKIWKMGRAKFKHFPL